MRLPAACLSCLLLAAPAVAEEAIKRCAPRAEMLAQLAHRYHASPRAWHVDDETGVLLEFIAATDGSWTVIGRWPHGDLFCIVGSGIGAVIPAQPHRLAL